MPVIMFSNLKGGVAKTTNAVAVAECLAWPSRCECCSGWPTPISFRRSRNRSDDPGIVPTIPDHLSVRGSIWFKDRLRRANIKRGPLGTLWSMCCTDVATHMEFMKQGRRWQDAFPELPPPFMTEIPNAAAIAASSEQGRQSNTFHQKYASKFANCYMALCGEIMKRWARMAKQRGAR